MKISKKTGLFYALLLLSTTFNTHKTHAMEPEDVKKVGWVALAGAAIVGGYAAYQQFLSYIHTEPEQPIDPFNFTGLPKDVQNTIISLLTINTSAKTLQEAAQAINRLAQVNKELNTLINDPQFCLQIIKQLSQKFNCSNITATQTLQTKEAKNRLKLQKDLKDLIKIFENYAHYYHYPEKATSICLDKLTSLYQAGVDLEFTYDNDDMFFDFLKAFLTPLMIASIQENLLMIDCLLQQGSNINQTTNKGKTALMLAAECSNASFSIEKLLTYSVININQQDENGNTALMYAIKGGNLIDNINVIELLLNAGADPEIANNEGLTPLQAAKTRPRRLDPIERIQHMINLIEEAIDKKHSKK